MPLGWRTATIRRTPSGGGLAVSHISTEGTPKGAKRAQLGFDLGFRSRLLSIAFDEIRDQLTDAGIVWDGLNIVLATSEEQPAVDLRLVTMQGKPVMTVTVSVLSHP